MSADAMTAAMAAWNEGKEYERRERERRIGWTYLLTAATFLVVVLAVFVAQWTGTTVAGLAVVACALAYTYARKRLFRWLAVDETEIWGVRAGFIIGVGAIAFAAAFLAQRFGLVGFIPTIVVGGYAIMVAMQALRARDRTHAAVATVLLVAALLLPAVADVLGTAAIGLAALIVGLSLAFFGAWRLARGRRPA